MSRTYSSCIWGHCTMSFTLFHIFRSPIFFIINIIVQSFKCWNISKGMSFWQMLRLSIFMPEFMILQNSNQRHLDPKIQRFAQVSKICALIQRCKGLPRLQLNTDPEIERNLLRCRYVHKMVYCKFFTFWHPLLGHNRRTSRHRCPSSFDGQKGSTVR